MKSQIIKIKDSIIKDCLNNKITVYEYSISQLNGFKIGNNSILLSSGTVMVEGDVDYSKMTDEEIDEYDNKLYLSIPHDAINIKSVKVEDIIQKIKDCHTILFILTNETYINHDLNNKDLILKRKDNIDTNLKIKTEKNLDLFDTSEFIILTWTDFHKYGYI